MDHSDAWLSKHLGMDKDDIPQVKQITGRAALLRDVSFSQMWQPIEAEEGARADGEDD